MEEKKLLKINLSDFSFSKNKTQKKTTEKKPEGNIRVRNTNAKKQTNTLRKKSLLNLIRQHQQKQYDLENNFKKPTYSQEQQVSSFNKEFEEAKNYLNTIAEKKSSSIHPHNTTVKNYPSPEPSSLLLSENSSQYNPPVQPVSSQVVDKPEYGCLKNGNLPTYRNYMNKTLSNKKPLVIGGEMDRSAIYNTNRDESLKTESGAVGSTSVLPNRYPSLFKKEEPQISLFLNKPKPKKLKQRKTIRRKHKVGRSKYYSKIGVLVSNRTIRNTISNQMQQLKMVPIHEVRSYLIKNGFIKVGSNTPNDVLRKMYESALLVCGEIKNHNKDNLLYNFLHDTTKEE
jgi:hypothetical protein